MPTACGMANPNAVNEPEWFSVALREYMIKEQEKALAVEEDQDWADKRREYISLIGQARQFGDLMNILYYDFELYNDITMIIDVLENTGKELR